ASALTRAGSPASARGGSSASALSRPSSPAYAAKSHRAKASAPRPPVPPCAEPGCSDEMTAQGYCRLHYIKNWKMLHSADERRRPPRRPTDFDILHKVPTEFDERGEERARGGARPIDLELAEAREDVEAMFREMGFEDD